MSADNEAVKSDYRFIVGIGASAGGLEALQKLLSALPPNTGFPYIIVQHMSPDYKSMLSQILAKYTEMPVEQAEDGIRVEKDHVYIIQPGKMMTITDGCLHYTDQVPKELNLPIDGFFRSLAEYAGPRAIAIVLSGTGSDGANGIKIIKENDGLVIAQDLESSKFDGMPRSAVRTGLVDAQIAPEEIALELEHISGVADVVASTRAEREADAEIMKRVYSILRKVSNVNFTHYKQTTIIRRMERRMMLTHRAKLGDYVDFLSTSPEEAKILSKDVLIGVTSFFRDPELFLTLKEKGILEILKRSTADEPVRVWVAGCSTGEEAYSIAILFAEAMETLSIKRSIKIFATDLDAESIDVASKGVYGYNIMDSVSPARLSRFFTRRNNTYTVNRDIRKMIVFSPHNVFQDPPFGKLDLISCRNMLIYFQPVLQNDLFSIFHMSLKDGGFLFLGKSESIGPFTEAFPLVDSAAKVFTHRRDIRIPGAKKVPFLDTTAIDDEFERDFDVGFSRGADRADSGDGTGEINAALLEKFMPASIVVNEKNELVHTFGNNANYVHVFVGKFTNNLFDLLTEALKIPVSTLLKEAREKKGEVQYTDVHIAGEHYSAVISITVLPVSGSIRKESGLYAIVLAEQGRWERSGDSVPYDVDVAASRRITDLEQDNNELQSRLDRSVAEQECVNEELQAANEELLTANEELQSSNEELQSVNEELYTVNSEYQSKMNELNVTSDDLANFLSSTLTGIIFVDNKLNIRRYTDYVTKEFSIMDHDIGRSLKFISYHFPAVDITEICTQVLKTLIPDEREIATVRGKYYFMRVAPYRSVENKIMGCVITLIDITSQKQGEATLLHTEKQLYMARHSSDAKSDYLTHIANEMRAPVSSLLALTNKAMERAGDKNPLREDMRRIIDMVEYMTAIVTNLSEASISEQTASDRAVAPFSLAAVFDNILAMMGQRSRESGVKLDVSLDVHDGARYRGNKNKVQQILASFVNNAFELSRTGGGTISLHGYEEPQQGKLARLCFTVADNGIGVKKEHVDELFKPFALDNDDDGLPAGVGLGLSIAYNLITSMDGDVSVQSEEGKGSVFTIHIMLERCGDGECEAAPVVTYDTVDYGLAGCKALLAEDNELNRTILEAMLQSEGVTYTEAADGQAAVDMFIAAPEGTYDCILLDMRMPNLDGIRAAQAIRASGKADGRIIPIIGVSANGYADDIKKAREAGFDDYLTKPIDRDELLAAMKRLLRK